MKRFYFTLLLFCIFCKVNFVFSQDDKSQEESEHYSYPNNDRVGYYVVFIFDFVFMHLNISGKKSRTDEFLKFFRFLTLRYEILFYFISRHSLYILSDFYILEKI